MLSFDTAVASSGAGPRRDSPTVVVGESSNLREFATGQGDLMQPFQVNVTSTAPKSMRKSGKTRQSKATERA